MLHRQAAGLEQATPMAASGPSFSVPLKVLATMVTLAAAGGLWGLSLDRGVTLTPAITALFVGALLLVVAGWWNIVSGRTSIDGSAIRQTGLWCREVEIATIGSCHLIHWPRLAWLIAPRLIVRSGGFGASTYYASHAGVLRAFERLAESGHP